MVIAAKVPQPALVWDGRTNKNAKWPRPLAPGATIGLFAPASHFSPEDLERGAEILRSWGLRVKIPKGLVGDKGFLNLAGDDEHRAAILSELMQDDSVDGLMAVRGGYGCQRLLPILAPLWAQWPAKPIFGFSDLTALHLARFQASGVIGFHSPTVAWLDKKTDDLSRDDLRGTLTSGNRSGHWTFSPGKVLKAGRARGPLLGGNLTLLTALLTSPWLPNMKNAILLLEDVGEKPYQLDRLMISLRQSPVWKAASGLVFGSFTKCGPKAVVARIIKEAADDFNGPVIHQAPFGHSRRNRIFPLGATAELNTF